MNAKESNKENGTRNSNKQINPTITLKPEIINRYMLSIQYTLDVSLRVTLSLQLKTLHRGKLHLIAKHL
jgi:hypothetical protein